MNLDWPLASVFVELPPGIRAGKPEGVDREVWANAGIELVVESAQREMIGSFPRAFKFDTGDRRTFDGVGRAGRYAAVGIQRNFVRVLAY